MTRDDLIQRQSLPLDAKIAMSRARIREWAQAFDGDIFVAFSGGKDSQVLLHLVRKALGDVPGVMYDTGLEFPEVRSVVLSTPNVVLRRPEMSYREVIEKHGWPVVSKTAAHALRALQNPHEGNENTRRLYLTGVKKNGQVSRHFLLAKKWHHLIHAPFKISDECCNVMKKNVAVAFEKESGLKPIVGTLAADSRNRLAKVLRYGCNAFDCGTPRSAPMSFWTDQDVLQYIRRFDLPIATVYGDIVERDGRLITTGEQRTGCVWCMFGADRRGPDGLCRFQRLALTHPKIWHGVVEKMGVRRVAEVVGFPVDPPAELVQLKKPA